MARPSRQLWKVRRVVRRRHRTWMLSMVLATAGWGVWWLAAFLKWVAPAVALSASTVAWIAAPFALVGLAAALWSVRAKAGWLVLTLVPLFANTSLLLLPLVLRQAGLVGRGAASAAPDSALDATPARDTGAPGTR